MHFFTVSPFKVNCMYFAPIATAIITVKQDVSRSESTFQNDLRFAYIAGYTVAILLRYSIRRRDIFVRAL